MRIKQTYIKSERKRKKIMKVTINGKISNEALKSILETQKEKTKTIADFCKREQLDAFSYKDAELEFDYVQETKPKQTKKIEVRTNDKRN
jgi:hypothetical protein